MLLDTGAGPDDHDSLGPTIDQTRSQHTRTCMWLGRVHNPILCVMSHMGVCIIVNERGDGCVHNDGWDRLSSVSFISDLIGQSSWRLL